MNVLRRLKCNSVPHNQTIMLNVYTHCCAHFYATTAFKTAHKSFKARPILLKKKPKKFKTVNLTWKEQETQLTLIYSRFLQSDDKEKMAALLLKEGQHTKKLRAKVASFCNDNSLLSLYFVHYYYSLPPEHRKSFILDAGQKESMPFMCIGNLSSYPELGLKTLEKMVDDYVAQNVGLGTVDLTKWFTLFIMTAK